MLGQLLDWFGRLPPVALYFALALTAAAENVFPPLPSDTVVAFGSFVAARGPASVVGTCLATLLGNLAGAMFMYWVGRRYGAERVLRRFAGSVTGRGRLEELYGRHGLWAIAVSRFLPGVRAVVPPVAGALGIPPLQVLLALGLASAVWYGGITYLAFSAGANLDVLVARIVEGQRWLAIGAAVLAAVGVPLWWLRRRRR